MGVGNRREEFRRLVQDCETHDQRVAKSSIRFLVENESRYVELCAQAIELSNACAREECDTELKEETRAFAEKLSRSIRAMETFPHMLDHPVKFTLGELPQAQALAARLRRGGADVYVESVFKPVWKGGFFLGGYDDGPLIGFEVRRPRAYHGATEAFGRRR